MPTTSFGRMLSEALIVVHAARFSKIKLILVTQDKIVNRHSLELLKLEFPIWKSLFARKFYSLLVRLNFLLIDQDSLLNDKFYFENLFKAQRYFRKDLSTFDNRDPFTDITNNKSRPIIIFAARTDTYWNLQNNRIANEIAIRNSDVHWTEKTIDLLINNGFFVIRLGTQANPKLAIESPFYFDYSLSALRSDKNDFRIAASADFAVTTAGGISLLPALLGVPGITINSGLFTDIQPQEFIQHYLPKSVFRLSDGSYLSGAELAEFELRALQKDSDYKSIGLGLRSVNPEDALTAILDFYTWYTENNLGKNSNNKESNNFLPLPFKMQKHFPKEIAVPESSSKINIKVHRLWKNF